MKPNRLANVLFVKAVNWGAVALVALTFVAFVVSLRPESKKKERDLASIPIPGPAADPH